MSWMNPTRNTALQRRQLADWERDCRLAIDPPCRDQTGVQRPPEHSGWPATGECIKCFAPRGVKCRQRSPPPSTKGEG